MTTYRVKWTDGSASRRREVNIEADSLEPAANGVCLVLNGERIAYYPNSQLISIVRV